MTPPDDPEDVDPGGVRARTQLAWTRTALSFGGVGAVIIKTDLGAGLVVLAMSPVIWGLGRIFTGAPVASRPGRLLLISCTITAVSVVTLVVALRGS